MIRGDMSNTNFTNHIINLTFGISSLHAADTANKDASAPPKLEDARFTVYENERVEKVTSVST